MAVLAHPDDESFGLGGTLALYARRGHPVHLMCATRREAGECDPSFLEGFESVAARREAELRCAAGILRLAGVHFLDYRDSGMPGSADNEHPNMAPPSIADVDGDGELEIVESLKDALGGGLGGIQIWDVPGSAPNCLLWPTGRSNYLRTGAPEG